MRVHAHTHIHKCNSTGTSALPDILYCMSPRAAYVKGTSACGIIQYSSVVS